MADQLWKISCLTVLLMFITVTVFECYREATYKCILPKIGIVLFYLLVKLYVCISAFEYRVGMSGPEASLEEKLLFILLRTDLIDGVGYLESDKCRIGLPLLWELIGLEAEDKTSVCTVLK